MVKLDSEGLQISVIMENLSENSSNLEIFSFLSNLLKHICFYPNQRMLNRHTFVSSIINIRNLDSIRNKRKNLCTPGILINTSTNSAEIPHLNINGVVQHNMIRR